MKGIKGYNTYDKGTIWLQAFKRAPDNIVYSSCWMWKVVHRMKAILTISVL